jgi:hypothetical protein
MKKFVRQPPPDFDDAVLVAGGEVDEYHISIGFYGDALSPDELTSQLGRAPTSSCSKGDIVHKNGSSRIERTGRWLLALPERPGEQLEPQLEELFDSLTQDLYVWKSLSEQFKNRFVVGTWVRSWNRGLEISPQLLRRILERQLGLGIDIYVDYDEHDV